MLNQIEFLKTRDGSSTIYLKHLDETYHSINGAFSESLHVYIINGLKKIKKEQEQINILEVGFGTGLNALLTMDYMLPHQKVNYMSIEPFPLDSNTITQYYNEFCHLPFNTPFISHLVQSEFNKWNFIHDQFNFCLMNKKLQELSDLDYQLFGENGIDIIYYDAFAPAKQSEMWDLEVIEKATQALNPNGFLTTYCAQGQFKRNLKSLGLRIESVRGPLGKREMTLAHKQFL
jgi:tRNA U34 5-methylaminomethyl-2-thiouridine-forming methyltransferase MnmC